MMTREDMMRELELLPVWQSRAPAPEVATITDVGRVSTRQDVGLSQHLISQQNIAAEAANSERNRDLQVQLAEVTVEDSLVSLDEYPETLTPVNIEPPTFTHIASDDGECLFVLPSAEMNTEELQLFQNICKALRIKTKPAETSADISESINNMQAKLLVAMGETTAQAILQSAEPIAHLRGKPHQLHGVALVATYDLKYLLQNPADKAKVWNDLCMGLQILQDLKVANS